MPVQVCQDLTVFTYSASLVLNSCFLLCYKLWKVTKRAFYIYEFQAFIEKEKILFLLKSSYVSRSVLD